MSDEDYDKLVAEFERIDREYNTPELARKHLQEMGFLDKDGEPVEQRWDIACP